MAGVDKTLAKEKLTNEKRKNNITPKE